MHDSRMEGRSTRENDPMKTDCGSLLDRALRAPET